MSEGGIISEGLHVCYPSVQVPCVQQMVKQLLDASNVSDLQALLLGKQEASIVEATCEALLLWLPGAESGVQEAIGAVLVASVGHAPPSCIAAMLAVALRIQMASRQAEASDLILEMVQQRHEAAFGLLRLLQRDAALLSSWRLLMPSVIEHVVLKERCESPVGDLACQQWLDQLVALAEASPVSFALGVVEQLLRLLPYHDCRTASGMAASVSLLMKLARLLYVVSAKHEEQDEVCRLSSALADQAVSAWCVGRGARIALRKKRKEDGKNKFSAIDALADEETEGVRGAPDVSEVVAAAEHICQQHAKLVAAVGHMAATRRDEAKRVAVLAAILCEEPLLLEQRAIYVVLADALTESMVTAYARLIVLPLLIFPFLQGTNSAVADIKAKAAGLLFRLERLLASSSVQPFTAAPNGGASADMLNLPVGGSMASVGLLVDCLRSLLLPQGRGKDQLTSDIVGWLDRVAKEIGTAKQADVTDMTSLLLSPFLFFGEPEARVACCAALAAAVSRQPLLGVQLLPVILYQLAKEQDSGVQLALLHLVPTVGVHSLCTVPAFQVLSQVAEDERLLPLSLRLMTTQWVRQSRIFPRLRSELVRTYRSCDGSKEEVRIAVGACLRDICMHRPANGVEMVKLLSLILKDPCGAVVALGLDGLRHLCEADCLEFTTAWEVIEDSLAGDERPEVLSSLFAFFSVGLPSAHEPVEDEDNDALYRLLATMLWDGFSSAEASVRLAAVDGLQQVQETGSCYPMLGREHSSGMCLIEEQDSLVEEHALCFASKLLQDELANSLRRSVAAAGTNFLSKDYSSLKALATYVDENLAEGSRPSLTSALAGGSLWSFHPKAPTKKASQRSGRGMHLVPLNGYRRRFLELLSDVNSKGNWLTQQLAFQGWMRFMAAYVAAAVALDTYDGQQVEQQAALSSTGAVVALVEEVKRAAEERAGQSPACAENCIFAVAGLAASLPDKYRGQAMELVEDTRANLVRLLEASIEDIGISRDQETYAHAVSLGAMSAAIHLTDAASFEAIYGVLATALEESAVGSAWVKTGCAMGLALLVHSLAHATSRNQVADKEGTAIQRVAAIHAESLATLRKRAAQLAGHAQAGDEKARQSLFPPLVGAHIALAHAAPAISDDGQLLEIHASGTKEVACEDGCAERRLAACLSLASVAARAYHLGALANSDVAADIQLLLTVSKAATSSDVLQAAASFAVCTLVHAAMLEGYPMDLAVADTLGQEQVRAMAGRDGALRARSLHALAACNLAGAGVLVPGVGRHVALKDSVRYLGSAFACSERSVPWVSRLGDEVKRVASGAGDAKLAPLAAWCCGLLARPLPPVYLSAESELKQLPKSSLLRSLLQTVERKDEVSAWVRGRALKALASVSSESLPRVNWAPALHSLLKSSDAGVAGRKAAFTFAARNLGYATVGELLSSTTEKEVLCRLHVEEQELLIAQMPLMLCTFATSRATLLLADATDLTVDMLAKEAADEAEKAVILRVVSATSQALATCYGMGQLFHLKADVRQCMERLVSAVVLTTTATKSGAALTVLQGSLAKLHAVVRAAGCLEVSWLCKQLAAGDEEQQLRTAILLPKLVKAGLMQPAVLAQCRAWCFSLGDHRVAAMYVPYLAAPLRQADVAVQEAWLLDALDAMTLATDLLPGLMLTGYLLALWCQREVATAVAPAAGGSVERIPVGAALHLLPVHFLAHMGSRKALGKAVRKLHSLRAHGRNQHCGMAVDEVLTRALRLASPHVSFE